MNDRRVLTAVLAAVGTAVLAWLGLTLAKSAAGMAPVWLANVILVAPIIRFPAIRRDMALVGATAGLLIANLASGAALGATAALTLANIVEIVIAIRLVTRFRSNDQAVHSSYNIVCFLIAAGLVAPVFSALIGAGYLYMVAGASFWHVAPHWYAADALGMIIAGPLILAGACTDCMSILRSTRRIEVPILVAVTASVTLAVFAQDRYPALFLILPFLTIAAFRLRFIGAASTVLTVAVIAIAATLWNSGPIAARLDDLGERLLFLQAFLGVAVIATMPLAAILVERGDMLDRLSASEERFRRIADGAPMAMFRADWRGQIVYTNPLWSSLMGDTRGGEWTGVIALADREAVTKRWKKDCWHGATGVEYEFARNMPGEGRVRLSINPELDAQSHVSGWIGIAADIEEERRAEERLEESEQQYRLLADNSNDMIVRMSLDGVRLYVSPASRTILGYEPEIMIGDTPIADIHPEDRARVERTWRTLLDGEQTAGCTFRQRRSNGSYAWLEATYRLVSDKAGAPTEIIASIRDIGRRRKAEIESATAVARLEESHRLLLLAEGLAGVGHWRLDTVNQGLFWSDEIYKIYGLPTGKAPTLEQAIDAFHPDDHEKVRSNVEIATTGGMPWRYRARLIRTDGSQRHLETSGHVERAPDGTVVGLVGVLRDITDQIEAEQALIAARDEAQASASAKSAFLATMSHEIRTPMTGVLGMIELLRTDLAPADRERFFDNLEQSASLLMTVLDDILDFSKIESNNLVLEQTDFSVSELARNTIDLFHHSASKKGLLLALSVPVGRDTLVRGDPVRLQQVISNLISNAIKFTHTGKVELRVDVQQRGRKQLVTCEVVDTGIGIAGDKLDTLFEPFIQGDLSTTRRFGGTGLGLAISKRLVAAMNGEISVSSVEGKGTTFSFTALLASGKQLSERKAAKPIGPVRPLSILMAEDNQINRALVEAIVKRSGHAITSVENGLLAVKAAEAEHFDAILMDMQMPEMDGLAATRAIRKGNGPCATVPIIALTADASPERRRFYDNAGLTEFLTKPIDSRLLGERLRMIAADGPFDQAPPKQKPVAANLIDDEKLAELEAVVGSASVAHLVDMLLDELASRPATIARLVEINSRDTIAAEAHALKGATLNVGADLVGAIAGEIEQAAISNGDLTHLCNQLTAAAWATRAAFDARAKRKRPA